MEIELSSGAPADLHPTIGAVRGLVLVPDIDGRRPLFTEMAESLSSNNNWNVIVVDPLEALSETYDGPVDEAVNGNDNGRHSRIGCLDDDRVVNDLVDAANRLEVDPVAIIGFSVGGMYAIKAAAAHRFDKVVSFYGTIRLPSAWRGRGQREPIELLRHVEDRSAVLAVVAGDDPLCPSSDVDGLVDLGVKVARYEHAPNGFAHEPDLVKQRSADAADAWTQVSAHIGPTGPEAPSDLV